MFLTGYVFIAAFVAGVAAWVAHRLMRRRTYTTPIPRYFVGVVICLAPWSLAVLSAPMDAVNAIVGCWLTFGGAAIGTWIGYEQDRPATTEADIERLAALIVGEHTDGPNPRD